MTSQTAVLMPSKATRMRAVLLLLAPVVAYGLVRPLVSSDALALGVGAAIPVIYGIALAIAQRRVDPIAVLSAIGFSLACLISVLTGGSSLPLKLNEAFITFGLGWLLLVAVLLRRPLPIGRLLRVPTTDKRTDSSLGAMIGGFLVLHALVHFGLAESLPTSSFLTVSRVVDWGTVALFLLALRAYVRRRRALGADD